MAGPPRQDRRAATLRIRRLLALEIVRLLSDLSQRRDFLLGQWSFHRDRRVFQDTLYSRWTTLAPGDLVLFDDETLAVLDCFYRDLDELRIYLATTEDMFENLQICFDAALEEIQLLGTAALAALDTEVRSTRRERFVIELNPDEPARHPENTSG